MKNKITAVVPIKINSRRLAYKNFLSLNGKPLFYYIFDTLMKIKMIDSVYCYTSQPYILSLLPKGVKLLYRPNYLDGDNIKANQLFNFAIERIDSEFIAICHATSPFIKQSSIEKGIISVTKGDYDSSFSVSKIQKYCWFKDAPINYSPLDMSQTQNLESIYSETSGFYVFKRCDYLDNGTRINGKCKFIKVTEKEAIDIDNKSDFIFSEWMFDYSDSYCKNVDDRYFIDGVNLDFNKGIRHVVFDMDGVLINSIGVMQKSWEAAVDKYCLNIPFSSYYKYIGLPFYEILNKLRVNKSYFDRIEIEYNRVSVENQNLITVYNEILDLLKDLNSRNIKISIVTSKPKNRALSIVKEKFYDINFSSIIAPEMVNDGRGKPYPDQLLLSFIKSGVSSKDTIYIGDTDIDRIAAEGANCRFLFAGWGYGENMEDSIPNFTNVSDLKGFIFNVYE
jgi:CMP-N-acetylneuraminic acid synthetase/phosphoglycolate phosphatase-like HAD superfamily hydrolase